MRKLEDIFNELKTKSEDNSTIIDEIRSHFNNLSEENKNKRLSLNDLKNELDNKNNSYSNEISMLSNKLNELTTLYQKAEQEKTEAEKVAVITAVLTEVGVKKNFDHHVSALKHMVNKGETGFLVKDKSLKDYCQSLVDSDQSITDKQTKADKGGTDLANDVYSESELIAFNGNYKSADQAKLNRSLAFYK